jgi:cell wall-associated NlpC family hydrolase
MRRAWFKDAPRFGSAAAARYRFGRFGVAVLTVGATSSAVLLTAPASQATSLQTLQAKAASLASQIGALNAKLDVLNEEYNQAFGREQAIKSAISKDVRALGVAKTSLSRDARNLHTQAVDAYVSNGSSPGISAILSSSASSLPLQQTYLNVASGSLVTAISSYQNAEHQLTVRRATLDVADQQATEAADTIAATRASAFRLQASLQSALSQVHGKMAHLVALDQAARERAAARAAAAEAAAAAAAHPVTDSTAQDVSAPAESAPSAPSNVGGALAAIQAAKNQIGTPYEWAGSTPHVGFDCSGLTMYSWAQAGVSLPHSAQAQYESIEHVSLNDLQPGDLIFYASGGYIYHVIMYIGGGEAIQAENYGTRVAITPIMPNPYAAGRP